MQDKPLNSGGALLKSFRRPRVGEGPRPGRRDRKRVGAYVENGKDGRTEARAGQKSTTSVEIKLDFRIKQPTL